MIRTVLILLYRWYFPLYSINVLSSIYLITYKDKIKENTSSEVDAKIYFLKIQKHTNFSIVKILRNFKLSSYFEDIRTIYYKSIVRRICRDKTINGKINETTTLVATFLNHPFIQQLTYMKLIWIELYPTIEISLRKFGVQELNSWF